MKKVVSILTIALCSTGAWAQEADLFFGDNDSIIVTDADSIYIDPYAEAIEQDIAADTRSLEGCWAANYPSAA